MRGFLAVFVTLSAGCASDDPKPHPSGAREPAQNSEFCQGSAVTESAAGSLGKHEVCGIPILAPTTETSRANGVKEFGGTGPVDLACFSTDAYTDVAQSTEITMHGLVKIFSNGCASKNVTVEVFRVGENAELGERIGAGVQTPGECETTGEPSETDNCDIRYECPYEYPGIPTETELVVRTSGDTWAPLYTFNLFVPSSGVESGRWKNNVRALARGDYDVIAQAAIGRTITPGHGALAGEVHDCGDVRLAAATVAIDRPSAELTYFTDNEDDPLPELSANHTSSLGLYAAIDVSPGPVHVAAVGLVNGAVVTAGYFQARVFADAVSSVTFRGLRPFQVP